MAWHKMHRTFFTRSASQWTHNEEVMSVLMFHVAWRIQVEFGTENMRLSCIGWISFWSPVSCSRDAVGPDTLLRVVMGPVEPVAYISAQLRRLFFTFNSCLVVFCLECSRFSSPPFYLIQWRGREHRYFVFVLKIFYTLSHCKEVDRYEKPFSNMCARYHDCRYYSCLTDWRHGTEPFLRSRQLRNYSRIS
jgi:hypothetical protein